jgi:hypothetical protein
MMKRTLGTKAEFRTVRAIIEDILEKDIRARNDDKYLSFRVMQYFTKIYIPFEDFDKMPSWETIKRVRAFIQNIEHRFEPTDPDVKAKRQRRQQEVKEVLREFER